VRQRRPGDPHDADHVHVEDPVPLLVVVRRHVALRADAGVVDEHVQPAEAVHHLAYRRPHRAVVGQVALDRERDAAGVGRRQVQVGDLRAAVGQQPRGGQPDAGRGAGHHRDPAGEVQRTAHPDAPVSSGPVTPTPVRPGTGTG